MLSPGKSGGAPPGSHPVLLQHEQQAVSPDDSGARGGVWWWCGKGAGARSAACLLSLVYSAVCPSCTTSVHLGYLDSTCLTLALHACL